MKYTFPGPQRLQTFKRCCCYTCCHSVCLWYLSCC